MKLLEDLVGPVSTDKFREFLGTYKEKFSQSLDIISQIPYENSRQKQRHENVRRHALYIIDKTDNLMEALDKSDNFQEQLYELKDGVKDIRQDFKSYRSYLKQDISKEFYKGIEKYKKTLDIDDLGVYKDLAYDLINGGNNLLRVAGAGWIGLSFFVPPSPYTELVKYWFIGMGGLFIAAPHAVIPGIRAFLSMKNKKK